MTAHRELTAYFRDGTARVVSVERDDDLGRRIIEATAARYIARGDVARVHVSAPTDRTAGTRGRGTHR